MLGHQEPPAIGQRPLPSSFQCEAHRPAQNARRHLGAERDQQPGWVALAPPMWRGAAVAGTREFDRLVGDKARFASVRDRAGGIAASLQRSTREEKHGSRFAQAHVARDAARLPRRCQVEARLNGHAGLQLSQQDISSLFVLSKARSLRWNEKGSPAPVAGEPCRDRPDQWVSGALAVPVIGGSSFGDSQA